VNVYSRRALLLMARNMSLCLIGAALYGFVVELLIIHFALQPQPWESMAALVNGLIMGVLLAFRNRAAYDRWWEGRKLWGQLTNETRNLAWKIHAYLPVEVIAHFRIPAALAGFAIALKGFLRSGVRLQEIPGFENDSETPSHVPSHLAGHILTSLATWLRKGFIDGSMAFIMDGHARALLDVCGGCERIRHTGITLSHKALLRLGIALNLLIAPWYTFPDLGYWGILVYLLLCFFLLGIEYVDTVLEEPFGTEPDDLDLDRYCQTIRQSVETILGEARTPDAPRGVGAEVKSGMDGGVGQAFVNR
jgi:ion channel-forming bestrophin family protein